VGGRPSGTAKPFPCKQEVPWNSFFWNSFFGTALLEQLFWNNFFGTAFLEQLFWNSFLEGVNSRFVDSPPSFSRGDIDVSIFWLFEKGNLI